MAKQKVYSAAEMRELKGDDFNRKNLTAMVGKAIKITSAVRRESEYGEFYALTVEMGGKTYSSACNPTSPIGELVTAALDKKKFPFAGNVKKTKSKSRKNAYFLTLE